MIDRRIDNKLLTDIWKHHRTLSWKNLVKGLSYERCAELPFVIKLLKSRFSENLMYLDIGSGESPLPTYFLKNTQWNITCLDKFSWVQKQYRFASHITPRKYNTRRFRVIEKDLFNARLPYASFDIITNVSVIEHFEGNLDSKAMKISASLLKPGGWYILTTLINEGYCRDFFLEKNIYGEKYSNKAVFYQRHYDLKALNKRIIDISELKVVDKIFFGDYGFQGFENIFQKIPKVVRVLYQWATPLIAKSFLSYRSTPVRRKDMMMNTSSGVILLLEK